jgi:hypothetical protein
MWLRAELLRFNLICHQMHPPENRTILPNPGRFYVGRSGQNIRLVAADTKTLESFNNKRGQHRNMTYRSVPELSPKLRSTNSHSGEIILTALINVPSHD